MENYRKLTQENFETLLLWLSPDRDKAGEIYEQIREKLLRYFIFKGCSDAEGLTDETINRVVGKLVALDLSTGNKPITIFYGFAQNVCFEHLKTERREVSLDDAINLRTENPENPDLKFSALEKCLQKLSGSDRFLVLQYYSEDKSQKFDLRRKLAEKQNLTMGAMHIKIHRLRKSLKDCIEKHLKNNL